MKKTYFDFIKYQYQFFAVSAIIVLAGIVSYVVKGGFVLGPDFAGGGQVTVNVLDKKDRKVTLDEFKTAYNLPKDVSIAEYNITDKASDFIVTFTVVDKKVFASKPLNEALDIGNTELQSVFKRNIQNYLDEGAVKENGARLSYEVVRGPFLREDGFGEAVIRTNLKKPLATETDEIKKIFKDTKLTVLASLTSDTHNQFHVKFTAPEKPEKLLDTEKSSELAVKKALNKIISSVETNVVTKFEQKNPSKKANIADSGIKTRIEVKENAGSDGEAVKEVVFYAYAIINSESPITADDIKSVASANFSAENTTFNNKPAVILNYSIDKADQEIIKAYRIELYKKLFNKVEQKGDEKIIFSMKTDGTALIELSYGKSQVTLADIKSKLGIKPDKLSTLKVEEKGPSSFLIVNSIFSEFDFYSSYVKINIENVLSKSLVNKGFEVVNVQYFSATIAENLRDTAIVSVFLVLGLILLYLAVRYRINFGIGGIFCLFHDALVMLAIISLFDMEMSTGIIIAILTVLGYSINDAVIIFDRIRENMEYSKGDEFTAIVNHSISQTLSRTVITVLTVVIADASLIILGGDALYDMSVALMIGLLSGTYSSIYMAAPVVVALDKYRHRKEEAKRVLAAKKA